jgi:hypothetical protein
MERSGDGDALALTLRVNQLLPDTSVSGCRSSRLASARYVLLRPLFFGDANVSATPEGVPSAPISRTVSVMTKPMIAVAAVLFVACGSPARPQTAQPPTGTLDQLLAPIALYPDQLLAQMLMSATDPAKVTELDEWLKSNQKLKGTQLQDAAVKAGFDASFVALVLFPQVVSYMAEQIAWTRVLGQAFTSDRSAVFASIQKLRKQAQSVGTLKSSPQQDVETKTTSSGEQVIVIEPTNPQIVYVPQYNTEVVYTQPPTTTLVVQEDNDAEVAVAAGLIGFTAGIAIGAAMDNNYYYGPYGWHGGGYMYAVHNPALHE